MEKFNQKQIDTLKHLVLYKLDKLMARRDNIYGLCLQYPEDDVYKSRYKSLCDDCDFYEELYKSI